MEAFGPLVDRKLLVQSSARIDEELSKQNGVPKECIKPILAFHEPLLDTKKTPKSCNGFVNWNSRSKEIDRKCNDKLGELV